MTCQLLKNDKVKIIYSLNNIKIKNSYLIKNDNEKLNIILELKDIFKKELENRTIEDIFYEWKAHNILYQKRLFRKRTEDTDLEINQKKLLKIGYRIICKIFKEKR